MTEPITNGSTTPESPKDESPVAEEPAAPSPVIDRPEPQPEAQPEPQPEQLAVNGLSLEEPAKEITQEEKTDESKEEPTAVTTEIVPEISVIKEVRVEQMPLIDSTPPPLPANPPPSSVASFAATTMAPESTDASLANTADNATPPPTSDPIANKLDDLPPQSKNELTSTQTIINELPSPVKEDITSPVKEDIEEIPVSSAQIETESEPEKTDNAVPLESTPEVETVKTENVIIEESATITKQEFENTEISDNTDTEIPAPPSEDAEVLEDKNDISNATEDLASPPSPICDDVDALSSDNNIMEENVDNTQVTIHETKEIVVVSNHISDTDTTASPENEINSVIFEQSLKAKSKDSLGNLIETIERNGNIEEEKETIEIMAPVDSKDTKNTEPVRTATTPDDSLPPSLSESAPAAGVTSTEASESFPLPPSELCRSESDPSPPASPADPPQVNTDRTLLFCSGISSVM